MNELPERGRAIGRVTTDPAANPSIGDTLTFQPIGVELLPGSETVFVERPDALNGVVLTVHFADGDTHDVDGTAVLVAPGVALTAKHVIEPHWDRLVNGDKHSMCIGITPTGMNGWTVKKVTLLTELDIAILGLELNSEMPPDRTFRQTVISTRLPRIGDRLQVVGFRANSATRSFEGESGYGVDGAMLVSAGIVRERYPHGRDRVMLPWPVLEVDCPTWGGMSGGPVFDEHGHLIGLLCSSFSVEEGDGMSYVSLLWPALGVKFEGGWPAAMFPEPRTLLQMSPQTCQIERPEAVTTVFDEATGQTMTRYSIWE